MRLTQRECERLVGTSGHGVLGTVHPARGVDLVPVVYVRAGGLFYLPIDTVKEKSPRDRAHAPLQRAANLAFDSRCALLLERWDEDWSKLWWVRVGGEGGPAGDELERVRPLLARGFGGHYTDPGSVVDLLVIRPAAWTGWAAGPSATS